MSLSALGRDFDLELELNPIFAPGAKNLWIDDSGVVEEEPERILYKGRVKGEDDSWVRVALRDGALDGVVWTPDETYFFEPAARFFSGAGASEMVAYRLSDTELEWSEDSCPVAEAPRRRGKHRHDGESKGQAAYEAWVASLEHAIGGGAATLTQIDVGLVADWEYYDGVPAGSGHFGDSASYMQNIINQVDGVYSREIATTLRIGNTVVHATSSDPFSGTTAPSTLLSELGTYRNNNDNSAGQVFFGADLVHFFTGRNLDGNVVGIAWLGTVCSSGSGAGLSEDYTTTNNSLVSLTAHEMGHNLSAPHDNQTGSACATMPSGFVMNPSVTTVSDLTNLHFSSCSKTRIASHLSTRTCVQQVNAGDPTPTFTRTPTPTPSPTRTPTGGGSTPYNAAFVSQTVPTTMTAGQQVQVSVTMRNTGTNVWTAAGAYRLGSKNPTDNATWGTGRVLLGANDSIANNQTKTFTFTVTAPTTPGQYNFQWGMVRDGFVYFGAFSTNVVVTVQAGALQPYNSEFVSQTVPTQMNAGQQVQVSVTMKNVGANTWTAAENYRLGSQNPVDNSTWGVGRVLLAPTDAIATGQSKTFTFNVTAPNTPGTYNFQWWMVRDGFIYFGAVSQNVVVNAVGAPAYAAEFVTQSVPTSMSPGQKVQVSVTMKNMGANTWTAAQNYRLGSQNPVDNSTWGGGRVLLDPSDAIATGQSKTFTFEVTAPSTPGQYNFQWWMVRDGYIYFQPVSANVVVNVG